MSELDSLLDDALADFENDDPGKSSKDKLPVTSSSQCHADFNEFTKLTAEDEEQYIEDLTKEFDKAFTDFLDATPDLKKEFSNEESSSGIDDNVTKTMEGLFQDAASSMPIGEDEEANVGANNMMPLLESLLSKLLSKEVLHEPLQELLGMYPEWLEANTGHANHATYTKQYEIVQSICDIFNSPDFKSEGSKVYSLLNEMQETGPPPQEIVDKMSQEIPEAMRAGPPPPFPPDDQCCIQ